MSVLCIIPALGGSKRIPQKNIKDFLGKPVIAYSIQAVKESGIADEIMVSTDSEEIAKVAEYYGAKVPFYRNKETSDDMTGIADVLLEVIERYKSLGKEFDYIACVLPASPLVQSCVLIEAYTILKNHIEAGSICPVQSFSYPPQRSYSIENGILTMIEPANYSIRTQDFPKVYHDCGQFFILRTEALLREKNYIHIIPCHMF